MKNIFFGPVGTSFQEWGVRALQNVERWINTLTEFRGATAARDGADGLVPQPKMGDQTKFLSGDGTFKTVPGGGGGSGTGDVTGPASSVDNAVARYDGTTGKVIQSSLTTISDAGTLATPVVTVNDDAYSAGWDGSTAVPTKNAIYDKIQTIGGGGNVSNVGTPLDNQIPVWTDATHIEGTPNFTYDGTSLKVIATAASTYVYTAQSNDPGAVGPLFQFYHNSASPAVSDVPGSVDFWGNNSVGTKVGYGAFQVVVTDPTAGSEDSAWSIYLMKAGVFGIQATLDGSGFTVFGNVFVTDEAYGATWDGSTAVPTKNAVYDKIQSLSLGGGGNVSNVGTPLNNQIAIWTTSTNIEGDADFTYDTSTNILGLTGTQVILVPTAAAVNLSLRSTDGGAVGPILEFFHSSPSPAVNDVVAQTYYYGNNSAAASKSYGLMTVAIVDPVAATEDGIVRWYVMKAGTVTNVAAFDGAGITSFFDVFTTDEAYGATWDGSLAVPTKNAVYDKIQTLGGGGFTAATQAEQEAASSVTVGVTPGRQQFHPSAAKAWGVATVTSGVPTLQTNHNITSITDTAVGRLTVTINVDFSSANYVCNFTLQVTSTSTQAPRLSTGQQTAGSFEVADANASSTPSDPEVWYFSCFGDQP